MNRSQLPGELPEPVRRYWRELGRIDPPVSLLDDVLGELDSTPRVSRFSLAPVAGMMAAAAIATAVFAMNLSTASPDRYGDDESVQPPVVESSPGGTPTLPPGVVPISDDPPISSVRLLGAQQTEASVGPIGWPVLAAHGSVWFGHSGTGQLTRVDASTMEVTAVIDVNPNPDTDRWDQLASADDQWVYAVGLDETLVQIDPATNSIVRRIPIGTLAYRIELYDGDAFITGLDGQRVTRVDLDAGQVVWQVRAGARPGGLEVTEEAVWVAPYGDAALLRLDPETGQTLEEYRAYVYGMEILRAADALYITGNQDRPMERFSISEGRVTARIAMQSAVIHDGRLYGLRADGQVVLLDPKTLEWQGLLDTGTSDGGMVAGEGAVWIADAERLLKIEPAP